MSDRQEQGTFEVEGHVNLSYMAVTGMSIAVLRMYRYLCCQAAGPAQVVDPWEFGCTLITRCRVTYQEP